MLNIIKYLKNIKKKYRVYVDGIPIAYFDSAHSACLYSAIEKHKECNKTKTIEILKCK